MTKVELISSLDPKIQRFTRAFVSHVLTGCDPGQLVSDSVDFKPFDTPTHVLAFGKGSVKMARACADGLGHHFAGGVVLAPDALIPKPSTDSKLQLQYYGVDHPSPTPRNVAASEALVRYARSIPPEHGCIVCISGGGSAHLCSPKPGVTLNRIIQTTNALNASGATIHELNESRRSLETLKAGGLAEILSHVQHRRVVVLSDVLDDDLEIVASGPMMNPDHPTKHTIVGSHLTALRAASEFLESMQSVVISSSTGGLRGSSTECGQWLAERFSGDHEGGAHITAGETTVNADGSTGIGGPCIEMALSAAAWLRNHFKEDEGWLVLGLATDGFDGPSQAAGAVITSKMLPPDRLAAAQQALVEHDSLPFLDSIHATIRTGPTGTNLNDLCMVCPICVLSASSKSRTD